MGWSIHRVPDLSDQTILITGANSGIGLGATHMLASRGAHVLMACRSPDKGRAAVEEVRAENPDANVELVPLDLADLDSVRSCAEQVQERCPRLDVLVNNAGVMALPYAKTADGFEIQLGTNHFGHFALTGLLLGHLLRSEHARIVTVASIAHFFGRIRFEDLDADEGYSPWGHYAQSKLANLLFLTELTRRVEAKGLGVLPVGCHPGYANTNINRAGAALKGASFTERFMATANRYLAQSTRMGALPTVYAATAEELEPGGYYGPDGPLSLVGSPGPNRTRARARDSEAARRLWEVSVERTQVRYDELET